MTNTIKSSSIKRKMLFIYYSEMTQFYSFLYWIWNEIIINFITKPLSNFRKMFKQRLLFRRIKNCEIKLMMSRDFISFHSSKKKYEKFNGKIFEKGWKIKRMEIFSDLLTFTGKNYLKNTALNTLSKKIASSVCFTWISRTFNLNKSQVKMILKKMLKFKIPSNFSALNNRKFRSIFQSLKA